MKKKFVLISLTITVFALALICTSETAFSKDKFVKTGSTYCPHTSSHTLTLLKDGRVLVIDSGMPDSGSRNYKEAKLEGCKSATIAELYDPKTGKFTLTGAPNAIHCDNSAVLLKNGKVLLVGASYWGKEDILKYPESAYAEIYDPETGKFTYTGKMIVPRCNPSAVLLDNGKVLIAGGDTEFGEIPGKTAKVEIYDPETGLFSLAGSLDKPRWFSGGVLLKNGKVLLTGNEKNAVIYDPQTQEFKNIGNMEELKSAVEPVLLNDGKVLIYFTPYKGPKMIIYDPETNKFKELNTNLKIKRNNSYTISLTSNNKVLIAGGYIGSDISLKIIPYTEIYDPSTNTVTRGPNMKFSRVAHKAIKLNNGKILIVGGGSNYSGLKYGRPKRAELYIPEEVK